MAFTHTISMGWGNGARSLEGNKNYTADLQLSLSPAVASDDTDLEVVVAIDVSEIEALYMKSDVDLTVEGNDGAGTDGTITLKAGVPYIWTVDSNDACLLTADITALYLTNDSSPATAGTFELEVLLDPTP